MAYVAPGVLTFGLGGDATTYLISFPFSLGKIILEYSPGGTPQGVTPALGEPPKYIDVRITVTLHNNSYVKNYVVRKHLATMLVRVTNVINTVTTNIKIRTSWIRKVVHAGVKKIWHLKK